MVIQLRYIQKKHTKASVLNSSYYWQCSWNGTL